MVIKSTLMTMLAMSVVLGISTNAFANNQSKAEVQSEVTVVPGDVLYFFKSFVEELQLIFTIDEHEEAALRNKFTTERIAEAEALLSEGKEEEAIESLQRASLNIKESEGFMLEKLQTVSLSTNSSPHTNDEEKIKEFKKNVEALTNAIEKVENPKAIEAIKKNIDKSLLKLEQLKEKDKKDKESLKVMADSKLKASNGNIQSNTEMKAEVGITDSSTQEDKAISKSKEELHQLKENVKEKKKYIKEKIKENVEKSKDENKVELKLNISSGKE